jgi:hypothetical protein
MGTARVTRSLMGSNTGSTNSKNKLSECSQEDHVVVELIEDPATVARYVVQARASGEGLTCARCEDATVLITAILILPLPEKPLICALCGDCRSEFPQKDTLFYRVLDD